MYLLLILCLQFLFINFSYSQQGQLPINKNLSADTYVNEVEVIVNKGSASKWAADVSMQTIGGDALERKIGDDITTIVNGFNGVQLLTVSLGNKVISIRGFSHTTNVRFSKLSDGADVQSPHIGAAVSELLSCTEPDLENIAIIPGLSSVLYGLNTTNGLVLIKSKDPFQYPGIEIRQQFGMNHFSSSLKFAPSVNTKTQVRWAKILNKFIACKVNAELQKGDDWGAYDVRDMAANKNNLSSLNLHENPAKDEISSFGNESPNRRVLTLNGKRVMVARTGYRENELDDYHLFCFRGDAGIFTKFISKVTHNIALVYKWGLMDAVYQRSNRFRLKDYLLNMVSLRYDFSYGEINIYSTLENTGKSYNLRSLAENLDRANKDDNKWFSDYKMHYESALQQQYTENDAHKIAREQSDEGRYISGSDSFRLLKEKLIDINNWDFGAALRVKSSLLHMDGILNLDQIFRILKDKCRLGIQTGIDERIYFVKPDGNYFINPVGEKKNNVLVYQKFGFYVHLSYLICNGKLRIQNSIRLDKSDYYKPLISPRLSLFYKPLNGIHFRIAYQMGNRFPSVFEGFSNINSGGVKRVGGFPVMSNGIFENSYTKTSIDNYIQLVNDEVNNGTMGFDEAIAKFKHALIKNPYSYIKPERVQSIELGTSVFLLKRRLNFDIDFYYNFIKDFIGQIDVSVSKSVNEDSTGYCFYSPVLQNKYRLWTNSFNEVQVYGGSVSVYCKPMEKLNFTAGFTFNSILNQESVNGLEDGFNTPKFQFNTAIDVFGLFNGMCMGINFRYQGSYNWKSFLAETTVPAIYLLDAYIAYQPMNERWKLRLSGSNILNRYYSNIPGGSVIGAQLMLGFSWVLR